MPRKPRIDYPGAYHHVINRGRNKQDVYGDDDDRQLFLDHLAAAADLHDVEVHSYALMSNHYHLLLRSLEGNLSETMQMAGSRYTQDINFKYGFDGALFKGRFFSKLIDNERYLMEAIRYIANNPVKAGIVGQPEAYLWSSYQSTLGICAPAPFLKASTLVDELFAGDLNQLDAFVSGLETSTAQRYAHVMESVDPSQVLSTSLNHLDKALTRFDDLQPERSRDTTSRNLVLDYVRHVMDVSHLELVSPNTANGRAAQHMLMALLLDLEICSAQAIATATGSSPAATRVAIKRFKSTALDDPRLRKLFDEARSLIRRAA